ncbi:MAG TPA: sugar transferase [Candidatus Acidoferrum sp.]|nr:sugar transferase [Candidatus Acidoferrum sp.]
MAIALEHPSQAAPPLDLGRSIARYSRTWVFALVVCDVALLLAATYLAGVLLRRFGLPTVVLRHVFMTGALTAALSVLTFTWLGLYRASFAMSVRDEFYHVIAALSLALAPVIIVFSVDPWISTSRTVAVVGMVLAIAFVGSARGIAHRLRDALVLAHPRCVAVIGDASRLERAEDAIRPLPNARIVPIAVSNIDGLGAADPETVAAQPWFQQAVASGCDTLVFTEILAPALIPYVIAAAERAGMTIAFAPPRIRVHAYDMELQIIGRQVLLIATQLRVCQPFSRLKKRIADLTIAIVALLLFAPVMALTALAIVLEDGGPIFYRQERVGRDGRTFTILKFRSMRVDAERDGAKLATIGDARVTRVGRFIRKTSIDELPQLVNVLRGEMSVVGPRPERPIFVEQFTRQYPRYAERHLVPPGITGWAQVYGKRVVGFDDVPDKLRADLFYIENWSLFMDIAVCLKTAAEVLFHDAAA